jgi:hypothetical protein
VLVSRASCCKFENTDDVCLSHTHTHTPPPHDSCIPVLHDVCHGKIFFYVNRTLEFKSDSFFNDDFYTLSPTPLLSNPVYKGQSGWTELWSLNCTPTSC